MTSALPRAARGAVRLIGLTSAAGLLLTGLATSASAAVTTGTLDCSTILASGLGSNVAFDVPDGKIPRERPQDIATPAETAALEAGLQERLAALGFDPTQQDIKEPININVYFHVISEEKTVEGGNIPRTYIRQQMKVLNHAFRGKAEADPGVRTPFKFKLGGPELEDGVDRVVNEEWFNGALPETEVEREMKAATYLGGSADLNVWTTNLLDDGLLGYAYYPNIVETPDAFLDGLVVDPETFPGGTLEFYNEGDTAVHEIGHYLGLAHTFDNGCEKPGDMVKDTAYEAEPYFGDCEAGVSERDSCPNKPGDDPVENFMDYSDDSCLDRFTKGQRERALEMWYSYRA